MWFIPEVMKNVGIKPQSKPNHCVAPTKTGLYMRAR